MFDVSLQQLPFEPDDKQCVHSLAGAPTNDEDDKQYGYCSNCKRLIVIGLRNGKPTGESWIVQPLVSARPKAAKRGAGRR